MSLVRDGRRESDARTQSSGRPADISGAPAPPLEMRPRRTAGSPAWDINNRAVLNSKRRNSGPPEMKVGAVTPCSVRESTEAAVWRDGGPFRADETGCHELRPFPPSCINPQALNPPPRPRELPRNDHLLTVWRHAASTRAHRDCEDGTRTLPSAFIIQRLFCRADPSRRR